MTVAPQAAPAATAAQASLAPGGWSSGQGQGWAKPGEFVPQPQTPQPWTAAHGYCSDAVAAEQAASDAATAGCLGQPTGTTPAHQTTPVMSWPELSPDGWHAQSTGLPPSTAYMAAVAANGAHALRATGLFADLGVGAPFVMMPPAPGTWGPAIRPLSADAPVWAPPEPETVQASPAWHADAPAAMAQTPIAQAAATAEAATAAATAIAAATAVADATATARTDTVAIEQMLDGAASPELQLTLERWLARQAGLSDVVRVV